MTAFFSTVHTCTIVHTKPHTRNIFDCVGWVFRCFAINCSDLHPFCAAQRTSQLTDVLRKHVHLQQPFTKRVQSCNSYFVVSGMKSFCLSNQSGLSKVACCRTDVDPKFLSGLGKIRIMRIGITCICIGRDRTFQCPV